MPGISPASESIAVASSNCSASRRAPPMSSATDARRSWSSGEKSGSSAAREMQAQPHVAPPLRKTTRSSLAELMSGWISRGQRLSVRSPPVASTRVMTGRSATARSANFA